MGKRQELREKRAQQERTKNVLIIVGIAVIAIAIVLLMALPSVTAAFKPTETPKPEAEIKEHPLVNRPQVKFNAMGDPNAPVKIIEYSDFQCPYCGLFVKETEQRLIDSYIATGKVYFEYHSLGVFIGPESGRAAEAAYCAGDQEKFWEMHDIIYANQTGENVGDFLDPHLTAFAKKLGLDMTAFNDCFTSNKYAERVKQDGEAGQQAGVRATPSFVVNGKVIEGAQPFEAFQAEIEAQLKK